MYDIKPLELEWKKYRKKRKKPWYIGGFIFFIVLITAIIFYGNFKIDLSKLTADFNIAKGNHSTVVKSVNSNVLLDDALVALEIEKSIVKKSIVIETVEKEEARTPNILVDIPVLEEVSAPVNENMSNVKNKIQLNIIETSSVTAYKDVEKRFLQSHDVDDSLFLAKSYYKKGLYKDAEYWALETNKLDENIEESVLIFVKSKAKLGHKNEAVSILTKYISRTASHEAKNLLLRIKNDTL